jgi:hypothetical protein
MKEKLIAFAIGAATVAALLAAYGFAGNAQPENIGRFRLHTTGNVTVNNGSATASKTYLFDSATGDVWFESTTNWIAMKRPRTATELP